LTLDFYWTKIRTGGINLFYPIIFFISNILPYSFVQYSIDCSIFTITLFFPPISILIASSRSSDFKSYSTGCWIVAEKSPYTGFDLIVANIYNKALICSKKDSSKYLSHSSRIINFSLEKDFELLKRFKKVWGEATTIFTPIYYSFLILCFCY